MSVTVQPAEIGEDRPRVEHVGFAAAVAGREEEFPLLARAVAAMRTADSPWVAWVLGGSSVDDPTTSTFNFCQIVRAPFYSPEAGGQDREGALTDLLGVVEHILWDGKRTERPPTFSPYLLIRTCGGVREFLGRDPDEHDFISLMPLRDLTVLFDRGREGEPKCDEWLAEFSLRVRARR